MYVVNSLQAEATKKLIAKEIKRHLRKFVKTSEMERETFEYYLEDWIYSIDDNSDLKRLYEGYKQLGGFDSELEVKIHF